MPLFRLAARQLTPRTANHIAHYLHYLVATLVCLVLVTAASGQTNTDGYTPSGLAPGSPAGSYSLSDFESVNLFSGNLSFNLPLMKVGGRGAAGYAMMLPIEQRWRAQQFAVMAPGETMAIVTPVGEWWGAKPGYGAGVLVGRRAVDESGRDFESYGCDGVGSGCTYVLREVRVATLTRLTFTAPDGTEFELRDQATDGQPYGDTWYPAQGSSYGFSRGTIFVARDGSAATFVSDTPISDYKHAVANDPSASLPQDKAEFYPSGNLTMRDGTRYRIENGGVAWIRDRNGNQVVFSGGEVVDSLGRRTTIQYHGTISGLAYDQVGFKGVGGADYTVRVHYASLRTLLRTTQPTDITTTMSYRALFREMLGASDGAVFDPERVASVELPDNRRYHFRYNEYGELARVELPTGGAFEYDWNGDGELNTKKSGANNYDTYHPDPDSPGLMVYTTSQYIDRRIIKRRVYQTSGLDSLQSVTTYEGGTVSVHDANGNLINYSKHYFHGYQSSMPDQHVGATGYNDWRNGREYKTEMFDVVNGTPVLRQTVENNWQQRAPILWSPYNEPANDPRLVETKTTLGDTNQVTKQTFTYDDYNNRTSVEEYAYGTGAPGGLLRRATTAYLHHTNPAYAIDTNIHLRSLPTQTSVFDAGGAEHARTTIEYDNYTADTNRAPLMPRGGITGMDAAYTDPNLTARGNPTRITNWLKDASGNFTTAYNSYPRYDVAGNVVSTKDARGNVSSVEYADAFADGVNRNTYAFPTRTISAVPDLNGANGSATPLTSSTTYDFSTGLPTSTTDANGVVTKLEYNDPLNRPTKVIRADKVIVNGVEQESAAKSQTTTAYDDANRTVTVKSDLRTTGDGVLTSQSIYDGLGRTTETRQYESSGSYIAAQTQYDALGRAYRASNPYRVENGAGGATDWTQTAFDALGRVLTVTTPDGAQVVTSYNGNTVTVTDQAGKSRRSETDALGRLTSVWEDPAGANYLTSYAYDTLSNLRHVAQGSQHRYFMYDSLSRLIRARNVEQTANNNLALSDPIIGNSSWSLGYAYDANGNLASRVDARGITTSYIYDALNRNISTTYTNDPTGTPNVTTIYDTATLGRGRLSRSRPTGVDGALSRTIAYDELGRAKERWVMWKDSETTASYARLLYSYNAAGLVTRIHFTASNQYVEYEYDDAGRVMAVRGTRGNASGDTTVRTFTDDITYSALGGISQERFGTQAALYHQRYYNVRGQLHTVHLGTTPNGYNRGAIINYYARPLVQGTSGAENNGNLQAQLTYAPVDDNGNGGVFQTDYSYDSLNRLTSASESNNAGAAGWQQGFGYDRWGNRNITSASGGVNDKAFAVNQATNQLQVPGGQQGTIQYDAAGNQTTDTYSGNGNRTYDAEGRLVQVTDASGNLIARYAYSPEGERMRRWVGGTEWWSGNGVGGEMQLDFVRGASGGHGFVYRGGELIYKSEYEASTATSKSRWLVSDHLGTPRMIADETGSFAGISRHDYAPFGEELSAGMGGRMPEQGYTGADSVRQKFTGKERDNEIGLDYFLARYYSSTQGRFTSPDHFDGNPAHLFNSFERSSALPYATLLNPQTLNLYTYVYNNPLSYVDPDGHQGGRPQPLPGNRRYTIRPDFNNPNDSPNVHVFDRNGRREIGRVAVKGTPNAPIYEWSGRVPENVRADVEGFIRQKGVQPRPPIHQQGTGARPRGGFRTGAFAGLSLFSAILDAFNQYNNSKQFGHYYNYMGQLVITDLAKTAENLPQGQFIEFEGTIFKLKGDTFQSVDPNCPGCTLQQDKEGTLYIDGCKRCAE